jgi:hypothetical protein
MHTLFSKLNIKAGIHTSRHSDPHHDWMILLRIFFILTTLLIIFSLYILYQIKNDQIFTVTPKSSEPPSLLREDLLDTTLRSFEDKAKKTLELKSKPLPYPDPSLR